MRFRVNFLLRVASLALLVASVPALHADTIVYNIDGAVCPVVACGLPIAGSNTGNLAQAVAFTPSANYTVTSASAVLGNTFNNTTVDFFIYSNSGSFPDASLGELGSATLPAGAEGVFTANAATPISVLANTQYWLVLIAGDNLTEVLWEQFAFFQEPYAYTENGTDPSDWMTTPTPSVYAQFAVYGTPTLITPEPASAWLLLTAFGLAGLIYFKRAALVPLTPATSPASKLPFQRVNFRVKAGEPCCPNLEADLQIMS